MSGLHWQRRWDPIRELQREMGRLFESLDPFESARQVQQYPPLNLMTPAIGTSCRPNCLELIQRTST